jgi:hypothetical protein
LDRATKQNITNGHFMYLIEIDLGGGRHFGMCLLFFSQQLKPARHRMDSLDKRLKRGRRSIEEEAASSVYLRKGLPSSQCNDAPLGLRHRPLKRRKQKWLACNRSGRPFNQKFNTSDQTRGKKK